MNPEVLSEKIYPYADSILIDKMKYISKTSNIYSSINLNQWLKIYFY